MHDEQPNNKISILVPTFNEEKYIGPCLDSLLNCTVPKEQLEILVIDGGSSDRTQSIIANYQRLHAHIKLIQNPGKIVACALNIGAEQATGEILVWVGAHAEYDKDYINKSAFLLVETGAASVGGRLKAGGAGFIGRAIAYAVSQPTGTGNARYRSGSKAGWVDTVFGGCWRKKDFLKIGGFDERWIVNQDTEFNYRLRKEIGGIYFSPEIRCTYFVRNSIVALSRQYFFYGMWRAKTFLKHPGSLRPRQMLPSLFVLALLLTILISGWSIKPLVLLVMIYFGLLVLVFAKAEKAGFFLKATALLCTMTLHISWGSGFLAGLASGQPKPLIN